MGGVVCSHGVVGGSLVLSRLFVLRKSFKSDLDRDGASVFHIVGDRVVLVANDDVVVDLPASLDDGVVHLIVPVPWLGLHVVEVAVSVLEM